MPECLCGGILSRQISAPFVSVDIPAYVSPASGRVISSRTQMRDDLARTGHIMNEPGLKNDISRWKTESDEKAFAPVAAAVDATVTSLVNSGSIES